MTKIWVTRAELRGLIREDLEKDREWEDVDTSDLDPPDRLDRRDQDRGIRGRNHPRWDDTPVDQKQWRNAAGLVDQPDADPLNDDSDEIVRPRSGRSVVGTDAERSGPNFARHQDGASALNVQRKQGGNVIGKMKHPGVNLDLERDPDMTAAGIYDDESYAGKHTNYAGQNLKPAIKQVRGRGSDRSKLYGDMPPARDPYTPNELRNGVDVADAVPPAQPQKPGVLSRLKNMFGGKKQQPKQPITNAPAMRTANPNASPFVKMYRDAVAAGDTKKAEFAKRAANKRNAQGRG